MKYYLYILFLLPLGTLAQEAGYNSVAFKLIEKKLKIDKNQVYWDFYTQQALQDDSLHLCIAFPLIKREKGQELLDLYFVVYNTEKQKIETYYKGEKQWYVDEGERLRGLEVIPNTLSLNKKTIAYSLRAFFSNSLRYSPLLAKKNYFG